MNYEYVEEEEVGELEGHTSGSIPPVAHTAVNHIKGMNILWGKCCGVTIILNSSNFSFPSTTLPNMLPMWFCGDISKKLPPYRMLRRKDVKQVKGGNQNLSNIKTLVKHVLRASV